MATVLDEVSIKGLRKAHFDQLLSNVEHAGYYYGNRKQYKKRHDELMAWVISILIQIDGNIIPNK